MMTRGLVSSLAAVAAVLLQSATNSPASAEELVQFAPAAYRQSKFAQARAKQDQPASAPASEALKSYLFKPEGTGPFPAVVLLHGCGGLGSRYSNIAGQLTAKGYIVLAVDSFATRGIVQACDNTMPDRRADALGALVFLSKLPNVAADRIAIVGYSQGGIVGLQVASMQPQDIFDIPPSLHYRAAVDFYPLCRMSSDTFTVPSLILIGSVDDWSPAKDCERLVARHKGATVKLVIYPGAAHGFDNPANADGKQEYGHLSKYDSDAAEKSAATVDTFLRAMLGKS